MLDETCGGAGVWRWSIVTSSATNSQLAGVLAGVLFTGMVLLFGRKGQAYLQTIALYAAAFLSLGLDSYLFSLITGIRPAAVGKEVSADACLQAWAQGMPASGLLATGGTALACGIGWMLSTHLTSQTDAPTRADHKYIRRLTGVLAIVLIATTTLLLTQTTLDFLDVMYHFRANGALKLVVGVSGLSAALACALLASRRTRRMIAAPPDSELEWGNLPFATYLIMAMSFGGTIFAGVLTRNPSEWTDLATHVVVGFGLVFGLIGPAVVSVLLANSLPAPAHPAPAPGPCPAADGGSGAAE